MLRQDVVPYRPGQYTHHDIISRVDFTFMDKQQLAQAQRLAPAERRRGSTRAVPDAWKPLEEKLLALPDLRGRRADARTSSARELRKVLDAGSFTPLKEYPRRASAPRRLQRSGQGLHRGAASASTRRKPEKSLIILSLDERAPRSATPAARSSSAAPTRERRDAQSAQVKSELTFAPAMHDGPL